MKIRQYVSILFLLGYQIHILGFPIYFYRLRSCFSKGRENALVGDVRVELHLRSRNPDSSEFWHSSIAPKLDFNECYYSVLEVDPSVDFRGLKKAYHKLVFKYHPDRKSNPRLIAIANNQMKVINLAYTVLRNSETRKEYDRQRAAGRVGARAQIKIDDANAADIKIKSETGNSSPSQPPTSSTTNTKSTSSTTPFTEEDIDLNRIRRNVEQVWANYMKTKQAKKDNDANSRTQSGSHNANVREHEWRSADQRRREVEEDLQRKRREREKTQLEREYEETEEENNQIYAAIFKIRGSALTVNSIKNGLLYLYRIKERKVGILNSDQRDWGEVTRGDEMAVYHRLKSIEVLKAINALISELEEKLHLLTKTYGLGADDDNEDEWNNLWQDEERFRKRYSNRDYYPPNQPRPQPQPQRSKDPRYPRKSWPFDDDVEFGFKRRVNVDDDEDMDDGDDDSDFFFLR